MRLRERSQGGGGVWRESGAIDDKTVAALGRYRQAGTHLPQGPLAAWNALRGPWHAVVHGWADAGVDAALHLPAGGYPGWKGPMEYPIGVVLAALVCALAMLTGFDRGRVFYPTLLMVIATYYILFAVMGNSAQALTIESLVASSFLVVAVAGFKKNLWLVVAALAGHGVFDFIHHLFIQNPGVPVWWPGFCLAFDILAGGFLAVLLIRRSRSARTATETAGEYQARLDSYIGDKDPI